MRGDIVGGSEYANEESLHRKGSAYQMKLIRSRASEEGSRKASLAGSAEPSPRSRAPGKDAKTRTGRKTRAGSMAAGVAEMDALRAGMHSNKKAAAQGKRAPHGSLRASSVARTPARTSNGLKHTFYFNL